MRQNKCYSKLSWRYIFRCSPCYDIFCNDFFYFILLATAHNFPDGNTCPCFVKTIYELLVFLESECQVALNYFNENKMIVNPEKFHAIIIDKTKQYYASETLKISSKEIKVAFQVKLLVVVISSST